MVAVREQRAPTVTETESVQNAMVLAPTTSMAIPQHAGDAMATENVNRVALQANAKTINTQENRSSHFVDSCFSYFESNDIKAYYKKHYTTAPSYYFAVDNNKIRRDALYQ